VHYPPYLTKITDPPPVLFTVGDMQLLQNKRMISIVGTRNMTEYGRMVIKEIVRGLVKNNFTVVSGMAFGVDREVHIQTMLNEGSTIAVLPTNPLYPIPKMNSDIHKDISNKGLVISESLLDGEVPSGSFPRRNRIIAGLSLGTIIIEASKSSGSLITANLAFSEGRQVFAVPGRIDQRYSIGCNSIIRDLKAKLVESVEDVLIEFGVDVGQKCNQENIYKDLLKEERDVIDSIISGQNTVDQLASSLGIEVRMLTPILGKLEILGYIIRKIDGTISTA
jgi:DNA processing protein